MGPVSGSCGRRPAPAVGGRLHGAAEGPSPWLSGRTGSRTVFPHGRPSNRNLRRWTERAPAGHGGDWVGLFVVGEPGLGKTRLVQECRRRFMAWVGAGTGRLPLWLEGRSASYESSTPYGLYQQLLSAWTGVAPEDGEDDR